MTPAYHGAGAVLPRTLERNRPDLVLDRPRTYVSSMDILTDVLDRVRLKGTVLFHYEFGRPWSVALPRSPDRREVTTKSACRLGWTKPKIC